MELLQVGDDGHPADVAVSNNLHVLEAGQLVREIVAEQHRSATSIIGEPCVNDHYEQALLESASYERDHM